MLWRERVGGWRRTMWWDDLRRDASCALRALRRTPGFAAIAILTFALGIGANTAIFSIVQAVLLRPLPYAHADRLVRVTELFPPRPGGDGTRRPGHALARGELDTFRAQARTLSHVAMTMPASVMLTGQGDPARLAGLRASASLWPMLDARAAVGRLFDATDEVAGAEPGVVLSHSLWRTRFGGDPAIVGRTLTLDGVPHAVRGVMAERFAFPNAENALWLPLGPTTSANVRQRLQVVARLADGVSITAARDELRALIPQLRSQTGAAVPAQGARQERPQPPDPTRVPARTSVAAGSIPKSDATGTPAPTPAQGPASSSATGASKAASPATPVSPRIDAAGVRGANVTPAPTPAQGQAWSSATRASNAASIAPPAPPRIDVAGVRDALVAPARPALLMLSAAVGIVLLIACVNIVNLLLARTAARQREIVVRLALGAGRGRIVRQLLTESLLLACAGGAAGLALAHAVVRFLRSPAFLLSRADLGPGVAIPRLAEVAIDARVLAFACAVSLLAGLAVGLLPALRHTGRRAIGLLRAGTEAAASGFDLRRGGERLQGALVCLQIGLAMMLFVAGALLIRSFVNLSRVPLGFEPDGVLTVQVSLPPDRGEAQQTAFAEALVDRLRALPDVASAGYAESLPLVRVGRMALLGTSVDQVTPPPPAPGTPPPTFYDARPVSRGFLTAMGATLVSGRTFTDRDTAGQPQVMVINRALARTGLFGPNPIGQRVYAGGTPTFDPRRLKLTTAPPQPWEIVGIIEDVHQSGASEPATPQFFVDTRQLPGPLGPGQGMYFVLRTGNAQRDRQTMQTALMGSMRAMIRQIEPAAMVEQVAPMSQLVAHSTARPRLYAVLFGAFAGVAVLLALVGTYGVMAHAVTRRTRELGIRLALGARRGSVLGLVMRQSVIVTVVGIAIGLAGAVAASRALEGMLFGLTPLDRETFIIAALAFAAVALLAAIVPARRATSVDPLIALRNE